MDFMRYDFTDRGQMIDVPVVFACSATASRTRERAAEDLIINILRQDFSEEICI